MREALFFVVCLILFSLFLIFVVKAVDVWVSPEIVYSGISGLGEKETVSYTPSSVIGEFIASNEIRIESQTYFGKFIDYQFQEINNTHWLVNYSVNEDLKNSIQTCLLSADKLSCFKTFCDAYLSDFMNSINTTCNSTKQYVWNDVLKLNDWKLINLTSGIKFDRTSIKYLTNGNFYIIFPEGFKINERASFGNPFDPEVTMIPNPANGTTYNGTIAETTHPAVTAGTVFVDASYNLVNTSNDQYARTTGSATVDAYVRTNFYLPQSIYYLDWIYITAELKNTANSDALHLALYNYTSGTFVDVNTTASSTTDKNLTFNISGSNITAFVDYRNMNVLTHLSGTSADNLDVDYVSALVSYHNPTSPVVINTGTVIPWFPHQRAICRDGAGNLHVVWRYNSSNVRYAKSSDNGTSWSVNTTFYGATSTSGSTKYEPHVSCDGNNITVSYEDYTADDVIVAISTDNGATWTWKNPVTSGVNGAGGLVLNERRGNNIYIIYQNSTYDLYFINSTDGGSTWTTTGVLVALGGGANYLYTSIAVNGSGTANDKIYVVFRDDYDDDIYFVNSTNSGVTWGSKIVLHAGTFYYPSMTFSGTNLYVTYDSLDDTYFINSTNEGITWTVGYTIMTTNTTIKPSVTLDNSGNPWVFWEDNNTNVNKDIAYKKYNGTAWSDVTYLTTNNLGNTYVNTPYKYYGDSKIHYIWRNGTASPYQIMYDYVSLLDTTPPTYSLNSTNSTLAGTPVEHRLKWNDDVGLSGYIFSFDNCTGTLVNDTFVSFSGTTNWSNITKTINSTVGCTIRWCVYANDTSNNWNGSSCITPFSYNTTSAGAGNVYNATFNLSLSMVTNRFENIKQLRYFNPTVNVNTQRYRSITLSGFFNPTINVVTNQFRNINFAKIFSLNLNVMTQQFRTMIMARIQSFSIQLTTNFFSRFNLNRVSQFALNIAANFITGAINIFTGIFNIQVNVVTNYFRNIKLSDFFNSRISIATNYFKTIRLSRLNNMNLNVVTQRFRTSSVTKFFNANISIITSYLRSFKLNRVSNIGINFLTQFLRKINLQSYISSKISMITTFMRQFISGAAPEVYERFFNVATNIANNLYRMLGGGGIPSAPFDKIGCFIKCLFHLSNTEGCIKLCWTL